MCETCNVITQLRAIEDYCEQARKQAYSTRSILGQLSAPAPSGDDIHPTKARLLAMINKRRKIFYKPLSEPKPKSY
jgi:hypothetical protein